MTVLGLIVSIALLGLLTWALVTFVPMPEKFKQLIIVVAIVVAVLWVLALFGVLPLGMLNQPVPRVR